MSEQLSPAAVNHQSQCTCTPDGICVSIVCVCVCVYTLCIMLYVTPVPLIYPIAMWLPRIFVLCKSATSSYLSQSARSEVENAIFEGENAIFEGESAIFQVGNAFSSV